LSSLAAFSPNVDGVLIPLQPIEALVLGRYNHVPVIEGTNRDEGRLFVALGFDLNPEAGPLTAVEYPVAVRSVAATLIAEASGLLGGSSGSSGANPAEVQLITNQILGKYPLSQFSAPGVALGAILTDGIFSCPAHIANEVLSLGVPTFGYELNDENAPMLFLRPVSFPYGATHTDELQFLFSFPGTASRLNGGEQTLAATMKRYWTNFARNGNPNFFGLTNWAGFSVVADNVQSLTPSTPAVEFDFAAAHKCNFWIGILGETTLAGVANALAAKGIIH
jgi:para-nitrobenzyl esterase